MFKKKKIRSFVRSFVYKTVVIIIYRHVVNTWKNNIKNKTDLSNFKITINIVAVYKKKKKHNYY